MDELLNTRMPKDASGRRPWRQWFLGTEPWTAGRILGEVLLLTLFAVLAFGVQILANGEFVLVVTAVLLAICFGLLRRPLPGLSLLGATGLSTFLPGLGILLPLVGWSAGKRIAAPLRALTFLGVAFTLDLLGSVYQSFFVGDGTLTTVGVLASALWFLSLVTIPGLTARYLNQRRTLAAAVHAQHLQLIRENAIIARETRLRERQRIARDMHDSLGHHLTLIAVHTGALQVDAGLSGPQREAVGVLREASVTAMRELREVVGLLKDDDGEEHGQHDSAPSVRDVAELVATSHRAGADVVLTTTGTPRPLAPAADQAAYRIVQEGLTNAHKYAPGAALTVALRYEPDVLLVEVVNAPSGPSTAPTPGSPLDPYAPPPIPPPAATVSGGRGLAGLDERARAAGGMLRSGPYGSGGFKLTGVLPYDAAVAGGDPRSHHISRELDRAMDVRARGCLPSALTIGGLLVALLITGVAWLFVDIDRSLLDRPTYQKLRVGQSEEYVRRELPSGSTFAGMLDAEQPAPERGSTCLVFFGDEPLQENGKGAMARFCFKDGKLVEKRTFD